MNLKIVGHLISVLIVMEGVAIATCAGVSLMMGDELHEILLMLLCAGITSFCGALGAFFLRPRSGNIQMGIREGFATVAGGWLVASIFGALPFIMITGLQVHDAFFETVSGFTTTGASLIDSTVKLRDGSTLPNGIESLSCGILFWRALTHWIGGM